MGIDLLDLSFRMEKHFRLKLGMNFWQDILATAQQVSPQVPITDLTVGQVHRELVQRLKKEGRYVETSYLAGENLTDVLSKLRERFPSPMIVPDMKLQELFGHQLRTEDWYELGDMFGVEMPKIGWSWWTLPVCNLGLAACILWPVIALIRERSIEFIAIIDIAVITVLIIWRKNYGSQNGSFQSWTVSQLAHHVLLDRTSKDGDTKWSEDLVWIALREILCDTLWVECEAVTHDALLTRDLGAS